MKTTLLTALVLFFTAQSFAQYNKKDITIAPHLGLALSTYTTDENVEYNYRTSLALGAAVDFYFNDRWSLRTGVFYAPLGAEDDFNNLDKLNYLSIPLNANWHFGSRRNWYLNFGPSFKFLMGATGEFSDGSEIELDDFIKSFDAGLDLGIGYRFNVDENLQLFGEYQGYAGFIDVLDFGAGDFPELRNSASIFNFGVVLKL